MMFMILLSDFVITVLVKNLILIPFMPSRECIQELVLRCTLRPFPQSYRAKPCKGTS